MKTLSSLKICAVIAALAITTGLANANPVFPDKISGTYLGTEAVSQTESGIRQREVRVRINQAADNLQMVVRRMVDGRVEIQQTVFRKNGVADYYFSVNGVVTASGFGRYSRRGSSLIVNVNVTDAAGSYAVRQRVASRANRISLIQSNRVTGSNTVLFADRLSR